MAKASSKNVTAKDTKVSRKRKAEPSEEEDEESSERKTKRTFELVDIVNGYVDGNYHATMPRLAASKAYTQVVRRLKKEGMEIPEYSDIYLSERTKGSKHELFAYRVQRRKLEFPSVVYPTALNDKGVRKPILNTSDLPTVTVNMMVNDKKVKKKITNKIGEPKTIIYYYDNRLKQIPVPSEVSELLTRPKKDLKRSVVMGEGSDSSSDTKAKAAAAKKKAAAAKKKKAATAKKKAASKKKEESSSED